MRIIDLFCGAGGFSYGFLLANSCFKIALAIDNDYRALQTYSSNITNSQVYCEDINKIHSCEILDRIDNQNPEVIIASPPCESFSLANPGRRKSAYEQLYSDESGRLVLEAIRLIIDLEPKIFVIENVSQLASIAMKQLIRHEFSHSDYDHIYFNTLEAEEFSVPSQRKRVFISNIKLKPPNNKFSVFVGAAFHSLPNPNIELFNHELVPLPPRIAKKIHQTPPGGALVYFKGSHGRTYRNYIRLQLNQFCPTVMGKSRFIHPTDSRLCTVREHARLMSYPDSFLFQGPLNWQFNQVGESVPPLVAKAIAHQVFVSFRKNESF